MESSCKKPLDENNDCRNVCKNISHCAADNRRDESRFDAILPAIDVIIVELAIIIGFLFTHFFLRS